MIESVVMVVSQRKLFYKTMSANIVIIILVAVIAVFFFNGRPSPAPFKHLTSKVLVIGTAGSGKSSLIRNMLDVDVTAVMTTYTVTKEVKMFKNFVQYEDYSIELSMYDTVGIGSVDNITDIIQGIVNEAKHTMEFDSVVILLKAERNNPTAHSELLKIMEIMTYWGAKKENLIVYVTHADSYSPEIQKSLLSGIKKFYKSVVDVDPEIGSFALVRDLNAELRVPYERKLASAKLNFLKKLTSGLTRFHPLAKQTELNTCLGFCDDQDCKVKCMDRYKLPATMRPQK